MSGSISLLVWLISTLTLLCVWVISAAFYSNGRLRLFIVASGIIFFLILAVITVSFNGLMRSLARSSNADHLLPPQTTTLPFSKHSANEIEFVSETFRTVVEQLQIKQEELNQLHARLGERAASAEAFSQYIVSSLPSGLIAFDLQGFVRVINQPAREIFSLSDDSDSTEISYRELFQTNRQFLQIIEDSLANKKFVARAEVYYQTQTDQIKSLGITIAPLEVSSQTAGALCLVSDITEINRLKEQLSVQQNLESLGLMSAGLAHEFKNSLAALHAYAQFLNRQTLTGQGHQAAKGLTDELKKLSEMVTAFLNFSRPQPLNLIQVSLEEILKNCVAELSALPHYQSVKFIFRGDFPTCTCDLTLFNQVVSNILHNALQAVVANPTSKNEIIISGATEADQGLAKWIKIEIEDSGNGIAPSDLPFVFVPFFTTKTDGHGIGLALAHRIVTQHGGTLTVRNSTRGGAVFTLKLRAKIESQSKA